jgi:antitoxin HicB
MSIAYLIKLEPDDNGTLLVTCPDLPGVVTYGEDRTAAIHHAADAIETWIASLMADGRDVPRPRPAQRLKRDEALVRLPALTSLKIELFWAMRDAGVTRAELARRLNWNREPVERLLRLDHRSRLEQIEAAFAALGRTIDVSVRAA